MMRLEDSLTFGQEVGGTGGMMETKLHAQLSEDAGYCQDPRSHRTSAMRSKSLTLCPCRGPSVPALSKGAFAMESSAVSPCPRRGAFDNRWLGVAETMWDEDEVARIGHHVRHLVVAAGGFRASARGVGAKPPGRKAAEFLC